MLTRINKARDEREAGFTLIELLVVVIIIGILAAIAIPVFLNQRNAARSAAVESDVRNTAIAIETYYTQNQSYPTDAATLATAIGATANLSDGVGLLYVPISTTGYYLAGCNEQAGDAAAQFADTYAEYNSTTGGVVPAADVDGTVGVCNAMVVDDVTYAATLP